MDSSTLFMMEFYLMMKAAKQFCNGSNGEWDSMNAF